MDTRTPDDLERALLSFRGRRVEYRVSDALVELLPLCCRLFSTECSSERASFLQRFRRFCADRRVNARLPQPPREGSFEDTVISLNHVLHGLALEMRSAERTFVEFRGTLDEILCASERATKTAVSSTGSDRGDLQVLARIRAAMDSIISRTVRLESAELFTQLCGSTCTVASQAHTVVHPQVVRSNGLAADQCANSVERCRQAERSGIVRHAVGAVGALVFCTVTLLGKAGVGPQVMQRAAREVSQDTFLRVGVCGVDHGEAAVRGYRVQAKLGEIKQTLAQLGEAFDNIADTLVVFNECFASLGSTLRAVKRNTEEVTQITGSIFNATLGSPSAADQWQQYLAKEDAIELINHELSTLRLVAAEKRNELMELHQRLSAGIRSAAAVARRAASGENPSHCR